MPSLPRPPPVLALVIVLDCVLAARLKVQIPIAVVIDTTTAVVNAVTLAVKIEGNV